MRGLNDFLEQSAGNDTTNPSPFLKWRFFITQAIPGPIRLFGKRPLEAWLDLLFLITRFGRRVTLKKGERLELQNVKVVVEEPQIIEPEILAAHNLDEGKIGKYYMEFLEGELTAG